MNNIDLILKKVKKVWEAHPELRLGQMLCNVANYGALYYSTNEEIIKLLEQFYKIDTSDVEKETAAAVIFLLLTLGIWHKPGSCFDPRRAHLYECKV